MGTPVSRPQRPKFRVLLPTKRNSSALRHRISLNKETLDRILQQIGHPAAKKPRVSVNSRRFLEASQKPSSPQEVVVSHTETAEPPTTFEKSSKHVDTNKPLPPLPSSVSFRKLEQDLERDSILRHREETLRHLESKQPRRGSRMRVPAVILRRIEKSAGLLGSVDSRVTRRNQGGLGLVGNQGDGEALGHPASEPVRERRGGSCRVRGEWLDQGGGLEGDCG
jgi:hypothetical protein